MNPEQNQPNLQATDNSNPQGVQQDTNVINASEQSFGKTINPITPNFTAPQESPRIAPVVYSEPTASQPNSVPVQPVSLASVAPVLQPTELVDVNKKPKKSHIKLFIKIVLALIILSGIGVAIWSSFFNNLSLVQYYNDKISIMVPESYVQVGDYRLIFLNSKTVGDFKSQGIDPAKVDGVSGVFIDYTDSTMIQYSLNLSSIEEANSYIYNKITEGSFSSDYFDIGVPVSDVTFDTSSRDGLNIHIASGNTLSLPPDKQVTGKFKLAVFTKGKMYYQVKVIAQDSDTALANTASKIIDSFKAK